MTDVKYKRGNSATIPAIEDGSILLTKDTKKLYADIGTERFLLNESADIPIATSTTLGGVKPTTKTDDMVQEIGVDSNGKLWGAKGYNISYGTTLPTSGSEGDIFIQI